MTSFRGRKLSLTGKHQRVQVFGGPDPDHRALLGVLTCTVEEADALLVRLEDNDGPLKPGNIVVYDTPDDDDAGAPADRPRYLVASGPYSLDGEDEYVYLSDLGGSPIVLAPVADLLKVDP